MNRRPAIRSSAIRVVAASCFVALLSACDADPRATLGDEGALRFKYVSGHAFVAVGGYPMTQSLAPGTTEAIRPDPALPMTISTRSSDDSVATFEILPDTLDDGEDHAVIWVHAHAAGSATLEVLDEKDALVDRVTVHVAAPARAIIVSDDVDQSSPLTLGVDGEASVYSRCLDADGAEVLATFGWTWRTLDGSVAQLWATNLTEPDAGIDEVEDTESVATVLGRGQGTTTLEAVIAGVSEGVTITVQ